MTIVCVLFKARISNPIHQMFQADGQQSGRNSTAHKQQNKTTIIYTLLALKTSPNQEGFGCQHKLQTLNFLVFHLAVYAP